jgi:hypothetical protein
MKKLDHYLQELFGGTRASASPMVFVSDVHVVHEAGFDVCYSRYSVTYRDARGEIVLAAEFDEEGELAIHSAGHCDATTAERISAALDFLGVKHAHR